MVRRIGIAWLLSIFILLPSPISAQRALHWGSYDIAVTVGLDGSLRVEETQRIVIDEGTFRTGSRSFTTGSFGRVRSVAVSEDGQPYIRGAEGPGTFSASDDGERFQLSYVFRDPTATEHLITISYVIAQSLVAEGDEAVLDWNFFCADSGCPEIWSGSLTFEPPAGVGAEGEATATGAPVRASRNGSRWRWELSEPIQGTQLALAARFPRAALGSSAVFRSVNGGDGSALQPDTDPFAPDSGIAAQPDVPGNVFSPVFCVVGLFILIIALSVMGSGARGRSVIGGPRLPGPGFPMPPMMGGGYGFPRRRRWGRWGRGSAGGYGGWGVPPVIPPIIPPSYGDPTPWDGGSSRPFPSDRADDSSGGGGFSWDNSGGGGSSWGDSGGGGASWGDSGGGGSSWDGDSGGGSSWGGGGDSGGGGGGGSNDSSSFN